MDMGLTRWTWGCLNGHGAVSMDMQGSSARQRRKAAAQGSIAREACSWWVLVTAHLLRSPRLSSLVRHLPLRFIRLLSLLLLSLSLAPRLF